MPAPEWWEVKYCGSRTMNWKHGGSFPEQDVAIEFAAECLRDELKNNAWVQVKITKQVR